MNKHKFASCLWIEEKPQEVADFYLNAFEETKQGPVNYFVDDLHGTKGDILTISLDLSGQAFILLNGGPEFTPTPAISHVVTCSTKEQLVALWAKLRINGTILMELGEMPGLGLFGWLNDRYGFSWQLKLAEGKQTITPCFLFTNALNGKAEEAIDYWIASFGEGAIDLKLHDEEGEIRLASFHLFDQHFYIMDSAAAHDFGFSLATSFYIYCAGQEEINRLWDQITAEGEEYPCGWMLDKYGVAWQTVTEDMDQLFDYRTPEKAYKTVMALYEMKRIDIEMLRRIFDEA